MRKRFVLKQLILPSSQMAKAALFVTINLLSSFLVLKNLLVPFYENKTGAKCKFNVILSFARILLNICLP